VRAHLLRIGTLLIVALVVPAVLMSAWGRPVQQEKNSPGVELPEGEGKSILERACTSCHDLGGLTNFKGFYTEKQWRELVIDMIKGGAEVKEDEIPILAKYLARHFGKESQ
jgi:hypothetical protein